MSLNTGYSAYYQCDICPRGTSFKHPRTFAQHLREYHCSKEGGSYVCRYAFNGVCSTLPIEGVSDTDYEDHIIKHHIGAKKPEVTYSSDEMIPSLAASSIRKFSSVPSLSQAQRSAYPLTANNAKQKWTIYNCTQNLPSVLNDPRKLKREPDFFTKTWGDTFTDQQPIPPCPFLPEIKKTHFERYLKRTSKRYKQHLKRSTSLPNMKQHSREVSNGTVEPLHRWQESNPDIEVVPKIFMQPDFSLENPETFNTVLPWSQLQPHSANDGLASGCAKQSAKLLQEQLSHYLDIIEVQLAKQISLRSEAFFHAMTSHDALREQLAQTLVEVDYLRRKVRQLEENMVRVPLRVLQLKRMQCNYLKLYKRLKVVEAVHQAQPTIQLLLNQSEFVGALDLISTTQEILSQELAGIYSFRHLGSQLAEIEKFVSTMMQADFIRYATSEWNRPLTEDAILREEERLVAIVFGMLKLKHFKFTDIIRDEACTAIKAVIKQTIIEGISQADDIDLEGSTGSLADQMKLLEFSKWLDLLNKVFDNLGRLLSKIQSVHSVIRDIVNVAAKKARPPNVPESKVPNLPEATYLHVPIDCEMQVTVAENDHAKLSAALTETLQAICDHTHKLCAKLITARAKDGSLDRLSSSEFVDLAKCIWTFTNQCEQFCGRKSTGLLLALQTQANRFASKFHEERKTKLSLILDSEQWRQSDVPSEFQELVDYISETGNLALPRKSHHTSSYIEKKVPQPFLVVDSEKYAVVGTGLMLLRMVVEYCQCTEDIPVLAPDMLTRLCDLLKHFNSRTYCLLLDGEALKTARLKTISTKNLVLASRCLQLVVHYLPQVKQHFGHRLPERQLTMTKHFDQTMQSYNNHIAKIMEKLVNIVTGTLMPELDKWEVKAPVPSASFRAISRHLSKLHEVISDVLPPSQLQELFKHIHEAFKDKFRQQIEKRGVVNDGGPQHGLVTQELVFYLQKLKELNVAQEINHNMEDLWINR